MLIYLLEILFYKCPYLALFSLQIVALYISECKDTSNNIFTQVKKHLPNFITWSSKQTTTLQKDSWVLRRTNEVIFILQVIKVVLKSQ